MGENVVTSVVPLFLDGSSSILQLISTAIKAWMSLNFVKIPSLIMGLAALEHLKNESKCCEHFNASIFNWIFFILAGNKDRLKSLDVFEFQSEPT